MRIVASLMGVVLFAGCAYDSGESVGSTSAASEATIPVTCTVTGTGTLASPPPASFSGSATLHSDSSATGTWTHTVLAGTTTVCEPADCPGNGRHLGHYMGRGRGHEIGRGRGHCEHTAEVCRDEPVYDVLVGTIESGNCAINGVSLGLMTGSGTWNGDPVTFDLNVRDSLLFGDNYELTVSDSTGVVYYVNDGLASGDISVTGI